MASQTGTMAGPRVRRWAVLALGFRPFYLLAAGFAAFALPLWLLAYTGRLPVMPGLNGLAWHIHEMLFGFAPAVIAGFLLTAVRNWTGQPTPTGAALGSLALLWLAGRVLLITGPYGLAAVVDVAFLPALALGIGIPVWRSRNLRNFKLIGVVTVLALLNATFHLAWLGYIAGAWLAVAYATALDVIALLIAIMAGRVIPAFTANAVPGSNPRRIAAVEMIAIGALVCIALADLAGRWWQLSNEAWAALLVVGAAAHTIRLTLWSPMRMRHNALLLMLPLAYAWLPVHLLLRAFAELALIAPAAATHALTIGAMASLMVAMMMRSALGHTGRTLGAGRIEILVFALLQVAALVRVPVAAIAPAWNLHATLCSGLLWTAGFAILFFGYWSALTRPRLDGKPG